MISGVYADEDLHWSSRRKAHREKKKGKKWEKKKEKWSYDLI
jgi:hypothetical protein